MNKIKYLSIAAVFAIVPQAWSQGSNYTNFITQWHFPGGTQQHLTGLPSAGTDESPDPISVGGSRFDLWTVKGGTPEVEFLLGSSFVGTYIPIGALEVITEDTTSVVKRTRCDRPYQVRAEISELKKGDEWPTAAKVAHFLWHVQSYGEDGIGDDIDRRDATLLSRDILNENESALLPFEVTSVPGNVRSKVRGEETFSIYSVEDKREDSDYYVPPMKLASDTLQVWPVADGTITGIEPGQLVRYEVPQLTLTMNDLYPSSTTYAQAYPGEAKLGVQGKMIGEKAFVWDQSMPIDKVLVIDNYGDALGADGVWTIELVTKTPFGLDRLDYVTFELDRTMKVRASFHTIE